MMIMRWSVNGRGGEASVSEDRHTGRTQHCTHPLINLHFSLHKCKGRAGNNSNKDKNNGDYDNEMEDRQDRQTGRTLHCKHPLIKQHF